MKKGIETLLATDEYQAVRAFVARVRNELPGDIKRVLLFGSKVRGDSQSDSDLDILLIVYSDDWRLKHQISSISADIGLEYDVRIDPRVITSERWDYMRRERFTFYENIARESIPLTLAA